MKRIISTLCGLAILCLFAEARAVPGTVAFTGRLSTSAGPVNGVVNMTFTLYTAPTAGSSVWTESRPNITASAGLVYVDLGAATTLDDTVFDGAPLFLEIIVGTETLSPRVPIRSVPYAFRASAADTADTLGTIAPGDVVTAVTGTGGITATRSGNTVSLSGTPVTGTAPIAVTGSAVGLTTCAANQIYKMVGGTWQCSTDVDTNTTYSAAANGGILVNASNQIGLIATCAAGQVLKAGAGGTWACANDTDTTNTYTAIANGGVVVNASNQIGLIATCAAGQVLMAGAGGTWACANDTDTNSGGTITGITTTAGTSGLDGGCATGNCSLVVDPTDFNSATPISLNNDTTVDFVSTTGTYSLLNSVTVAPPAGYGGRALLIATVQARCGTSTTTACTLSTQSVAGTVGWQTTSATAPLSGTDKTWGAQGTDNDFVMVTTMHLVNLAAGASQTFFLNGNCTGIGGCQYDQIQTAAIFLPN